MRVFVFAAAFLATGASLPTKQPTRQWSGPISIGKEAHFNRLNVDSLGNGELVDPQADTLKPLTLGPVSIVGNKMSFTVPHGGRAVRCVGRMAGDRLVGQTEECGINLTATTALEDPTTTFGAWRMTDGRVVAIGTMAVFCSPRSLTIDPVVRAICIIIPTAD